MATTVIYAHPYEGSFNPVYSKEELALFNQGRRLIRRCRNTSR